MNIVIVFLLIVILLLVILYLIDRSGKFSQPDQLNPKNATISQSFQQRQANVAGNTFLPTPVWSQPVPYNINTTGQCLAYTFLGSEYEPAQPSYALLNGSGGRGIINTSSYLGVTGPVQGCIDADQLFAATIQHECINENGTSAGAGCILTVATDVTTPSGTVTLLPGQKAPKGTIEGNPSLTGPGSEVLYSPCYPSNLSGTPPGSSNVYCAGSIGLVVPVFKPQNTPDASQPGGNSCLYTATTDPTFKKDGYYETYVRTCNLTDQEQMFRMVRYTMDSSFNLTLDNSGNLAAIVHRATGFYLAPSVYFQEKPSISLNQKAQISGSNPTGADVVVVDEYIFNQLNVNDEQVTDVNDNVFPDYVDLVLINPQYDTSRNGVYWLLQNQTINPQINPNLTDIKNFIGQGVYPTQSNFTKKYPQALPIQSYYLTQSLSGDPGIILPAPLTDPGITEPSALAVLHSGYSLNPNDSSGGPISNSYYVCDTSGVFDIDYTCWFGLTMTSDMNSYTVTQKGLIQNVPVSTSPQQIVYIPDLYLLPTITTDPVRLWTYLINSYSINLRKNDNKPILTPYRQETKVDTIFGIQPDTTDPDCLNNGFTTSLDGGPLCKNWFFTLDGYINGNYFADSQFIDYSQYVQQIQMPVAVGGKGGNSKYSSNANPLVPAQAPGSTVSGT